MAELIAATCGGFAIGWACRREVLKRRLRKPPYSSAAIAWRDAETQRDANDTARAKHAAEFYAKFIDPSLGVPWEEGRTQRGNGSGGATTPKPPIKPQPSGGRMINQSGMTIGYQPLPGQVAPSHHHESHE